MPRSVLALAAVALVAAGCDSNPAAPQAAAGPSLATAGRPAHENYRAPFSLTVNNPCPPVPEPVTIQGAFHYNAHFKFFEGGNSPRLMSNVHGSGLGLITREKYQFHELSVGHGHFTAVNNRFEVDQTTRFHVISQSSSSNFFSSMRVNVVCDDTGCKTTIVSIDTDCRG